jgi:hypothetical protein
MTVAEVHRVARMLFDELRKRGVVLALAPRRLGRVLPGNTARQHIRNGPPLPERVPYGGCVYIIRCRSKKRYVKIGHAMNIARRLSELQKGCPLQLEVEAYKWTLTPEADEKALHDRFAALWVRGEWFAPDEELEQLIAEWHHANINAVSDALRGEP